MVRAFAGEGAQVVGHCFRHPERAKALGLGPVVQADLTDEKQVRQLFSEAGALDVCAAVAGVWPAEEVPVWDLRLERWVPATPSYERRTPKSAVRMVTSRPS